MQRPTRAVISFHSAVLLSASLAWLAIPAPLLAQAEHLEVTAGAAGDRFGYSICLDGERVLVGMPGSDSGGNEAGSLARFDVTDGVILWQWWDPTGKSFDELGTSVALVADLGLVGVPGADDEGADSGAAWIVDAVFGVGVTRLSPADGVPGDRLGSAVALGASVAALGCSRVDGIGSVVLFDPKSGQQLTRWIPSAGTDGDRFGASLVLADDLLAAGAYLDNGQGLHSGAAYLYDLTTMAETAKLVPSDPQIGSWFGRSIAIGTDHIAVGAPRADGAAGAVYLYDRASGTQLAKITVPGLEENDLFGWSLAFSGSKLVIGAPGDDQKGVNAGSLYWLDPLAPETFTKVLPSTLEEEEIFGVSAAGNADFLLGGAPNHLGDKPGSVFVLHTYFDCNGNGVPDDQDITNGTSTDSDGDGVPDECECTGVNYCVANDNSTGEAARISWSGSLSVAANDLVLLATHCPPTKPALFFYGPDPLQVPFGNGWRCVGGRIFRLHPFVTDATGQATYPLDYGHLPPDGDITTGSTWNFQLWYRDPQAGGSAFNLSDALAVSFCD